MSTIQTKTLSTGVTVIVEPMQGVQSAGLSIMLPLGCAREPDDKQGLCAMYCELLLRGAGELDSRAHADAADRLGVGRSVMAGKRFLHLRTTALGERMVDALGLFADMVLKPRFEEGAIEPARQLALQGLASLADEPQERAGVCAMTRHSAAPMNRSTLGTEAGLGAITRQDICDQWAQQAVPAGTIVSVAGLVVPEQIIERLESLFEGWAGTASVLEPTTAGVRGYAHEPDETAQVQILVLHDAPAERDEDAWLERVVVSVLSGGMSGRLFTEVREKRALCYSVNASYTADLDDGTISAYVGTAPDRAQESLDVLLEQLHLITTPEGRITDEEFSRAIVGMKSRLIYAGESTAARASALGGDYHRLGRARSLDELAQSIDKITLDQVNEYAKRRDLSNLTIQTLGPEPLKAPE